MDFQAQYGFIQSSRKALLEYCAGIEEKDFIAENTVCGKGSIRNLLVHNANIYEYWIGKQGLKNYTNFTKYDDIGNVDDAETLFACVDMIVHQFINNFTVNYLTEIEVEVDGKKVMSTPLKLFTHVITHEFHHKGQILSRSRQLGYIPIDTDVIR